MFPSSLVGWLGARLAQSLGEKVIQLYVLELWRQTGMPIILKVLRAEPHPGLKSVCLLRREVWTHPVLCQGVSTTQNTLGEKS